MDKRRYLLYLLRNYTYISFSAAMWKNILLLLLSAVSALVLCELVLRVATPFPINAENNKVYDEKLVYRTGPKAEGVDSSGFRNAGSVPPYDIVTIGDSHTFGYNVKMHDNWPSVAGRTLGKRVYNLSAGGYNIIQYLALMEEALRLKPELIVLGFYAENDLRNQCSVLRYAYWQENAAKMGLNLRCHAAEAEKTAEAQDWPQSAVVSALDYLWQRQGGAGMLESFRHKSGRVFNRSLDIDGYHINFRPVPAAAPQGAKLRNGIRAFEWMQEQAQAQGVRLIVMFIPSIDLVVGKSLQERGLPVAPMLAQSPKGEVAQRELFMEMFRRSG
ncbi:MAG: SGNH/GDSL hydrolase family protein, partial [Proteobacteria bacterium]|nr:SGNH/GDSL hydrolase family protein [Pseudomonadota bacterium]